MRSLLSLTILSLFIFSCSPGKSSDSKETESKEVEMPKIELTKAPASPEYHDALLTKAGMEAVPNDSASRIDYSFEVENYELGVQTEDAGTRGIANSGKGQHIHYIVNNGPYSAHYMPGVNDQLAPGNYTVLAFLSRSYHESVKSPGAFHIENLTVGDVEKEEVDLSTPHMFYSRPKGTYKGQDAAKVMLDFYLLNCTLSQGGYNVKATINGEEFLIDEWTPYYMTGLPMGEVTIKLELLDPEGNLVDSPFNSVERTVTLEK